MKKLLLLLIIIPTILTCNNHNQLNSEEIKGKNMLLIGNSFFKPYAQNLDFLATEAGYQNHNSTLVFRGGENGRPINFWNDVSSNENIEIKAALDQGNIDFFGMTSGHDPEDRIEGHRNWIEYAIQNNPNITIFIAIPPIDYPAQWNELAQEYDFNSIQELYTYFVNDIVHNEIIDPLREEFPSINIFTIPTGWAAIELAQMNLDNLLLDEIQMFGPKPTSIFTDAKGHQGQIVIEAGTLVWLNSIYQEDLNVNDYETGFVTDLHRIAKDIMDNHNPNYKF